MFTFLKRRKRHDAALPDFDLHVVEIALRTNHRLYNGTPLTEAEIKQGIRDYRIFLRDHKLAGMPDPFIFPGRLVDRVWHTHMCETQQYHDDCIAYFGKVFHHRSAICDGGLDDAPIEEPIRSYAKPAYGLELGYVPMDGMIPLLK